METVKGYEFDTEKAEKWLEKINGKNSLVKLNRLIEIMALDDEITHKDYSTLYELAWLKARAENWL